MLHREDMHPYQNKMVDHITAHNFCALFAGMGLGKTVSSLTAVQWLLDNFMARKVLVVAPLRVARKVWSDEITEWSHLKGIRLSDCSGPNEKKRLAGLAADADIYTINRENLRWLVKLFIELRGKQYKIVKRWPFDTVILDESQSFKSQSSERWKWLRRIRPHTHRLIQLTGTPTPNGYTDLWSQMYLLDQGERLGRSEKSFNERWCSPPAHVFGGRWVCRKSSEKEINNLLSDIVLSLKAEDYLDLPPVVENYVSVVMTPVEEKKYKRFKKELITEIEGQQITAVNAGVLGGKLLQLANGAVYTEHPKWVAFHDHKINALEELIEGLPKRVIIAYNYKSDKERITQRLTALRLNWRYCETKEDEHDWNAGKIAYLIMHPASAGHGLNLQKSGASNIVWVGLNWSLELYQQLNARLAGGHRRTGKNVVIHHIVTEGTADMLVMEGIKRKDETQERLTDALRGEIN